MGGADGEFMPKRDLRRKIPQIFLAVFVHPITYILKALGGYIYHPVKRAIDKTKRNFLFKEHNGHKKKDESKH
jgi:hypothetical protein